VAPLNDHATLRATRAGTLAALAAAMRNRPLEYLLGTAVVVVAGAAYLAHAADPDRAPSPVGDPSSPAPAGDDKRPPRITRPVVTLPALVRSTDKPDEEALPDPAEAAARLETALVRHYETDRIDPAWSATMERAIADTFALPALAGSRLDRVACRGVICRLEIEHTSGAAQGRFLAAAGPTPAFRGAGAARPLVDPADPDRHRTLLYLMREGEPLPTIH